MTRRDFILISDTLNRYHASPLLIEGMADKLAGTNPKFDRQRFLRASGFYARPATVWDADLDRRRAPAADVGRPLRAGHNADGTLMQFHAPFNADNFTMTGFCEALHHEERAEEHVDHLRPVRRKSGQAAWRQLSSMEIAEERAGRDYRHFSVVRQYGKLAL